MSTPLLASVGVLSDIQCADLPDGWNFTRTEQRFYRHALVATRRAIAALTEPNQTNGPVQAILHFGDLIDGFNAEQDSERAASESALADALASLPPPATVRQLPALDEVASGTAVAPALACYHLIGNHELMNFPRGRWANELRIGALSAEACADDDRRPLQPTDDARQYTFDTRQTSGDCEGITQQMNGISIASSVSPAADSTAVPPPAAAAASSSPTPAAVPFTSAAPLYYDILVAGHYRLLMLDAYDVSVLGYVDLPSVHPNHSAAVAFLARENPNENKLSPVGLVGTNKRKVAFNGGISATQIEWIRRVLAECTRLGQAAILCSHVAFHPKASSEVALLWNQQEMLDLVHEYRECIIACLHGHDHSGGDFIDADGVTHHTFEAVLTSPDGSDAYGRIDFYPDRVDIQGTDRMRSVQIPRKAQPNEAAGNDTIPATDSGSQRLPPKL